MRKGDGKKRTLPPPISARLFERLGTKLGRREREELLLVARCLRPVLRDGEHDARAMVDGALGHMGIDRALAVLRKHAKILKKLLQAEEFTYVPAELVPRRALLGSHPTRRREHKPPRLRVRMGEEDLQAHLQPQRCSGIALTTMKRCARRGMMEHEGRQYCRFHAPDKQETPKGIHVLDEEDVAMQLCQRLYDHVRSRLGVLGGNPALIFHAAFHSAVVHSEAYRAMRSLTRYARTGEAAESFAPIEAIKTVAVLAYDDVLSPVPRDEIVYRIDPDPKTTVGQVMLAAVCRWKLSQKEDITAEELACLSGFSASHVRHLIRLGQLRSEGSRPILIEARSAISWLTERAVPGVSYIP